MPGPSTSSGRTEEGTPWVTCTRRLASPLRSPGSSLTLCAPMRLDWPEVLAQLPEGPAKGFSRPLSDRCITGIFPAALERIGVEPPDHCARLAHVPEAVSERRFKKLFLFIVDSLGLDDLIARGNLLRRWTESHGTWVTSVFPSITSSAIVSIFHGVPPAVHGIYGHQVWNSRVGNIVDMLTLQLQGGNISLPDAGVDVNSWLRTGSLLQESVVGDRPCYHVTKRELLGSGLTNFILPDNVNRIGYSTYTEGLSKVRRLLERDEPAIVSFYTHTIDYMSHVFGKKSSELQQAFEEVERGLEWFVKSLDPAVRAETVFALASDHGQCEFNPSKRILLDDKRQETYRGWRPHRAVGNSGRVLHLYGDGPLPRELEETLQRDIGDLGCILTRAEANELSGAPAGDPGDQAGDLGSRVVALHEGAHVEFEMTEERRRWREQNLETFVSNHGSLTPEELLVPTVIAGLDDLA